MNEKLFKNENAHDFDNRAVINEELSAENCLRILFRIVLESYVLKVGVC